MASAATGAGSGRRRRRRRRCASQVGPLLVHEANDVRQRRIVAQLAVLVARDVVDLADGGEHLRLLDGVDAEIGFQIEVEVQHVFRIAGLLDHQRENALLHGLVRSGADVVRMLSSGAGRLRRSGRYDWRRCDRRSRARLMASGARSGRFSYTKRMTCASVG